MKRLWSEESGVAWSFNPGEIEIVRRMAADRVRRKPCDFYERNKIASDRSSIEINADGLLSEGAVAAEFRLRADTSFRPRGDGGRDLRSPGGDAIDVKSSSLPYLIFNRVRDFRSDVAFLTRVEGDLVTLVGWTLRSVFRELSETRNFGYGDRAVMHSSLLLPVGEYHKRLNGTDEARPT